MPSATVHNESTHIPAWKRLGLKLRSQAPPVSVPETSDQIGSIKRKRVGAIDEEPYKKTKKNSHYPSPALPVTPVLPRKKSVTFTSETKVDDGDSIKQLFNSWVAEQKSQDPSFQLQNSQPAFKTPEPSIVEEQVKTSLNEKDRRAKRIKKPKQEQGKKSKSANPSKIVKPANLSSRPYLQYLRQYHESRDNWKFNKNHQTHLLKHVFDIDIIPSDHAYLIYPYVRGLQGGVRTRLRDAALAIKVKDQTEGAAGSPENMADSDKKQREYDAAMKKYVDHMAAANASSTMGYEEGVLMGLSDANMAKRVAKRTRAEQILAELETAQDYSEVVDKGLVNGDNDSQKRVRMNDGSTQRVARRRKQRTATVEDSSDSDDSEDDSSDDSVTEHDGGDDTSSSSSSSSSGSESEEEESEEDSEDSSEESEDSDE